MSIDPALWIVLSSQACIFVRCVLIANGNDAEELDDLRGEFNHDLDRRARRGDGPDWVRYMDEADRVHDRRVDRLRVWATAALVVGIGGTMATLAVRGGSLSESSGLIEAMVSALWASLSGVTNNLIITLWLFHRSDVRFATSLREFRKQLQEHSDANPPHEKFASAVRDQLGSAFREAVRTFPEAFVRLDESVQSLGKIIEDQSGAVLKAADGLKEGADSLTDAAKEIVPVAKLLESSTDRLHALPEQLKQAIEEARAKWEQEIRRDQDSFISGVQRILDDQRALLEEVKGKFVDWELRLGEAATQQTKAWNEVIESIQRSESEILKIVEGLPSMFSKEIAKISDTLGRQFGLEARQHVQTLSKEIRDGNETLRKQVETATVDLQRLFLNATSNVVAKTLDKVYRQVEGTLLERLAEIGKGIERALVELPDNAKSFATSLSTANQQLQLSIERLAESAAHLKQVAKLTENFEESLAEALTNAVAPNVESLQREVRRIVAHLERLRSPIKVAPPATSRPSSIIRRVSNFISRRKGD